MSQRIDGWLIRQFVERPAQTISMTLFMLFMIVLITAQTTLIFLPLLRLANRNSQRTQNVSIPRPIIPNRESVSLFNGQDLTGWKTLPEQTGDWKVENGVLVGRGSQGHLFSEKAYRDFLLRVECKLVEGDSGIGFRIDPDFSANANKDMPIGYKAQIVGRQEGDEQGRTGSIRRSQMPLAITAKNLITPGEWFTLEIVAQGNHLFTRVNGEVAADCHDPDAYIAGHLALQVGGGGRPTVVEFRKIEIQELTALDLARRSTAPAEIDRESAVWLPPEQPVPAAILLEAQADTQARRYDIALAKFVWYFEHALQYQPDQSSIRISSGLRHWAELARSYPPALEAMLALRDEAADSVRTGQNVRDAFHDLVYINRTIDEEDSTVELFKILDSKFPSEAKRSYRLAEPSLVRAKEFKLCGKYIDLDAYYRSVDMFHMNARNASRQPGGGEHLLDYAHKSFTNSTTTMIALLVVNDRKTDAQKIAADAVKEWGDPKFKAKIDEALTGKVPDPWPATSPVLRRPSVK